MTDCSRLAKIPEPTLAPVDVGACIRRVVELERRHAINISGGPDATVQADRDQLEQVLINLIGNAIKFTENGRVTVRALIEAEEQSDTLLLRFEVTDTGIGIPFDKQTRIFENFEQVDDSFSRRAEGTGLGLGIARRAVEAMGGEIGVVSSVGKGSTFWFTARFRPADPQEPAVAEARATPPRQGAKSLRRASGKPLDVLVAEDNEVNRIVLREMLQTLGHRVVIAENGRQAVQQALQVGLVRGEARDAAFAGHQHALGAVHALGVFGPGAGLVVGGAQPGRGQRARCEQPRRRRLRRGDARSGQCETHHPAHAIQIRARARIAG